MIEPEEGTDPPSDLGPSIGGYDELRPADARPPIVTRNTMAASHVQKLSGMPSPNKVFTAQMNTTGQSTTNGIPTAMMRNMAISLNPPYGPLNNSLTTFSFTSPRCAGTGCFSRAPPRPLRPGNRRCGLTVAVSWRSGESWIRSRASKVSL